MLYMHYRRWQMRDISYFGPFGSRTLFSESRKNSENIGFQSSNPKPQKVIIWFSAHSEKKLLIFRRNLIRLNDKKSNIKQHKLNISLSLGDTEDENFFKLFGRRKQRRMVMPLPFYCLIICIGSLYININVCIVCCLMLYIHIHYQVYVFHCYHKLKLISCKRHKTKHFLLSLNTVRQYTEHWAPI